AERKLHAATTAAKVARPDRVLCFFFSSRRRHTRFDCDWSSDVCSSDLEMCRLVRKLSPHSTIVVGGHVAAIPGVEHLLDADHIEIGRASCRERVEILAVAGALEKKKQMK